MERTCRFCTSFWRINDSEEESSAVDGHLQAKKWDFIEKKSL
jgi:hypothetical protein